MLLARYTLWLGSQRGIISLRGWSKIINGILGGNIPPALRRGRHTCRERRVTIRSRLGDFISLAQRQNYNIRTRVFLAQDFFQIQTNFETTSLSSIRFIKKGSERQQFMAIVFTIHQRVLVFVSYYVQRLTTPEDNPLRVLNNLKTRKLYNA